MKNRKRVLLSATVLILALVVIAFIFAVSNSSSARLQKQLDLGHRYMEELNYEQAIAAFEAAISIEPKCVEAYMGLADIYLATGDIDSAIKVLERGYDETDDDVLLERINNLKPDSPATVDTGISPSQQDTDDDWQSEFADLKELYSDYVSSGRGGYVMSNCDWKMCFLTVDEMRIAYDPLIARMEDYLEYKENHNISYQDEYEYFNDYISDYTIRELYIITHQFDKSGQKSFGHVESEDGYISDYDEYNRQVYFERKPEGNNVSFVWGDDGCVTSYTTVYTSDRDYPSGTVEEWTFQYDNGRITSAHIKQTSADGYITDTDFEFSYSGNTVTESFIYNGAVQRTVVYEINKFGGGTLISDSYDEME